MQFSCSLKGKEARKNKSDAIVIESFKKSMRHLLPQNIFHVTLVRLCLYSEHFSINEPHILYEVKENNI